ncbi:MAG: efflux RND transporter periplasmic adaptor subunit, partial [Planctomycetes bacterium]|nr:efflux RND transporter periplasmic adaptor subunit [Planctomycetota bacterium]
MNTTVKLTAIVATLAAASSLLLGWSVHTGSSRPFPGAVSASEQAMSKPMPVPDAALMPLEQVYAAYDRLRDHLALDQLPGVAADAQALTAALTAAKLALPADHPAAEMVVTALAQGGHLAAAASLEDAREHFATISHALVAIAEGEPRLQKGHFVFSCPMTKGYKKWIQGTATKSNPYMGTMMSTCGTTTTWMADEHAAPHAAMSPGGAKDIAFYTCSMHPAVKMQTPGSCPICSMDLIPVTKEQVASGEIMVDESRRQLIGIRTAAVTRQPMRIVVHAVGHVAYDESGYSDVSLKVGGWVTKLIADTTGAFVEKGRPLFTLYSPELYAAEQEYLQMLHAQPTTATAVGGGILEAAQERLRLWDLDDAQINEIRAKGAQKDQVIVAPASGYLIAKDIVQGAAVMPGQRLFRIAPIDRIWVLAEIFETDIAVVTVGQSATVSLPYAPGETFSGTIDYLYPYLNADTRSVRARIQLTNVDHHLRPD